MTQTLIQLQDVSKVYKKKDISVYALRDATIKVEQGEFVTVWGPSGSGKSTLLNILGTLDYPTSGQYHFNGEDVTTYNDKQLSLFRAQNIGFVFQAFNLMHNLSAIDNVLMPGKYVGKLDKGSHQRARALLDQVGLSDRANHLPSELSGGEEQRVAIARALMNDPQIILADEPTGNLDTKNHTAIMDLLQELSKAGKTLVVVSHNPEIIKVAKRALRLQDGRIVNDSAEGELKKPKVSIDYYSGK